MNDLPALNSAVAKVLGLSRCKTNWPVAVWEDADCTSKYQGDIALDWNALMAAVAKLEETNWHFVRKGGRSTDGDGFWCAWKRHLACGTAEPHHAVHWGVNYRGESESLSETEALARCIHAVVQEEG